MRESTTAVCRQCDERFPLSPRAGRNTGRGSRRTTTYAPAKYCGDACRKAASRARISRDIGRQDHAKGPPGTYTPSAVTSPEIPLVNQRAVGGIKTTLDPRIVPDLVYPGMYRIRRPDGTLTDMVNLTRARDALLHGGRS